MATDVLPEADVPVVSIVWQYTGMPADEIESRIVLVTERVLTASVNDIEHVESQSLTGVGVIRVYFRPGAKVAEAEAQVTATCQTFLKVMPAGVTPPYIVRYSASSVPVVQISVGRRDGRRAGLMTVLKGEGASTLDVVEQVRAAMPGIQAQVPPGLKVEFLFDQSVFVRSAVEGVLTEGAVVAGLTALMILLF